MYIPRLLASIGLIGLVALLAAACGGNSSLEVPRDTGDGAAQTDEPSDGGPASSGLVAPSTFLTFNGKSYELKETLQASLITEEFEEIGIATKADIEHEGELRVYRRPGDESAVYTLSPAVDSDGEEGDVPALWLRWEPAE